MKNKFAIGGGLLIIVLLLVLSITGMKTEDYTVKIANLPITEGLPLYLAIEKGYFKQEGIKIEYVRFDAPNQIIDAVMSGKVDVVAPSGAMGISAVADSKNPGKIKIYAASGGDSKTPLNGLYVKNGSDISKISDLKNKKLGVLPGIQWRTIATEILSTNSLSVTEDVTLVELAPGLHATALQSGQVDAVLTLEPSPTIIKQKDIGREIAPTPTVNIADPFYAGAGIINTDFINKHPEIAVKVLSIMERSIVEIQQNPNEARKYLKGYTALDESLIALVPMPTFKTWKQITPSDIQAIQSFYEIFYKHKVVNEKLDFTKLLYK
jgi:NitT/TauT family transport system substrate-binding protein